MKLFYFSGSTIPSSFANSVHVMKMCAAFAQAGCVVSLFGKGHGGAQAFAHYDVAPSFDLILSPHVDIPKIGGLIRQGYSLIRAACMGQADLIYGRDFWTISAMAGRQTPIAFELHEIPKQGGASDKMLRRILSAPNLKGLVVISDGLKQDFLEHYAYDAARILVAHDGADIPVTPIQPTFLDIPEGTDFQIGYGGSLYKGKGIELILQIAAQSPTTGFHIFGGPDSEKEQWIAQNPPTNIKFYGHQNQKDLKPALAACDALIAPYMPQITINTGADIGRWISPLKLFEYMALNKPILCSDLPVLREVMTHEQNCLLANPKQPEQWVSHIAHLKHNAQDAENIANHAFNDLKTHYSWNIRAKNILNFLQALS